MIFRSTEITSILDIHSFTFSQLILFCCSERFFLLSPPEIVIKTIGGKMHWDLRVRSVLHGLGDSQRVHLPHFIILYVTQQLMIPQHVGSTQENGRQCVTCALVVGGTGRERELQSWVRTRLTKVVPLNKRLKLKWSEKRNWEGGRCGYSQVWPHCRILKRVTLAEMSPSFASFLGAIYTGLQQILRLFSDLWFYSARAMTMMCRGRHLGGLILFLTTAFVVRCDDICFLTPLG